jgi:hypothetical protein
MNGRPATDVHVHIDRLVVDIATVRTDDLPRLRADVEVELRRRFASAPRTGPSRRRGRVRRSAVETGTPLGRAIAASLHSAATGAR